ncbi:hypothetical protein Tco_0606090 [Tanacetum coccineum]
MFIDSQFTWDYDSQMIEKYFAEYTRIEVRQFRDSLIQHMESVKKSIDERAQLKRQYDRRVNKRLMQMQESKVVSSKALYASLIVTECSGTKSDEHITSSSSGTYITHVVDADIRPVNDQVPSVEVHLTAPHNVLANEQPYTDQSEPSYDTYLLEKVDSNTTSDSTNMSHRGREIDQDVDKIQGGPPPISTIDGCLTDTLQAVALKMKKGNTVQCAFIFKEENILCIDEQFFQTTSIVSHARYCLNSGDQHILAVF